ncbi:MAG TPA: hypothetical protein VGH65_08395 [Verrucomicrobiaceae bacterium]
MHEYTIPDATQRQCSMIFAPIYWMTEHVPGVDRFYHWYYSLLGADF